MANKRTTKAQEKQGSAQKKKYTKNKGSSMSGDQASQLGRNEEIKSEDSVSVIEEEEDDQMNDIEMKYGFRQSVILEMTLPTGEREIIGEYQMKFLDRNHQARVNLEMEGEGEGITNGFKPKDLHEATQDYECTLSEVITYLKKCGYPLENCFISFFSPIFSAYINCGLDPLPASIKITKEDLNQVAWQDKEIFKLLLKFQWGIRSEYKNEDEALGGVSENFREDQPGKEGR